MPLSIDPRHDEGLVPGKVIVFKIQIVVNQGGSQVGVVTDSVAPNPRI